MPRRILQTFSFALVFLAIHFLMLTGLGLSVNAAERKPNVIMILADDIGIEGLGCYGGTSYKTPVLDQLATEGIRFSHAYAQPLCTNTRIQLMTSKFNDKNWIAFGILDPKEKTFGHYMKEAGYKTCIAGKWQLQSYDPPDYPGAEKRRGLGMEVDKAGFDEFCLWHIEHTELKGSRYADPKIYENGKYREDLVGKYGPDIWVDYINNYMERNKKDPFFIYYPMALPHWPMVPTPDSKVWKDPSRRNEEDTKYFKDMVEYMDYCVGRIVKKVDDLGLGEDTLILFYGDNGTHLKITTQTKTGPVAGGKGNTTDAGTHVPLIARWSNTIKPAVNDDLIDSTDFLPTILEAAQKPVPASDKLDGVSFYPQLLGKKGNPRDWIYCFYDPRPGWDKDRFRELVFARDKRFKLYEDGRLFDVPADQLEQKPILEKDDTKETGKARKQLAKVIKQNKQ